MRRGNEEGSAYDLEPICIIIARNSTEQPDEKKLKKAVGALLSDFNLIKTMNP